MTAVAGLDLAAVQSSLDRSPDAAWLQRIGLRAVHAGAGALERVGETVDGLLAPDAMREVVVLGDATAKCRRGEDVAALVAALISEVAVHRSALIGDHGRVHADTSTVAEAIRVTERAACVVTLGSGTVTDIGKVAAARHGVPHVVIQTATSVNGFADDQSVLLIDGVKRTTRSRWPDVLVMDTELLAGAPRQLTLAGVGDLAAMFTAPADWQLAFRTGMADTYSAAVVALVREHGVAVLQAAPGAAAADPLAIDLLAAVLALSGISMGAAGSTAPSSGMEHTVSHLLEMAMTKRNVDAALHGAVVGVSTVVAACLWERVLARLDAGDVRLEVPDEAVMADRVRTAFADLDPTGGMGEECWRLYSRKLARWVAMRDARRQVDWTEVACQAREVVIEPGSLASALAAAGAPVRFADLDPRVDEGTVRWALLNCHVMRDRFGVADLAFLMGMWDRDDVDDVLARAAAVGGGL